VIQDATDQQIKAIQKLAPVTGKTVLEIGCGKGRMTHDLAKFAGQVFASDPDLAAIKAAQEKIRAEHVQFLHSPTGIPPLSAPVDMVIYALSLHHVPVKKMPDSLQMAGEKLRPGGTILVLEPGDGGSFNKAKARFGVGSGDEGPLKAAAAAAMRSLPGWQLVQTDHFMTEFLFADETDFLAHKLPGFTDLPNTKRLEISHFLKAHQTERGIILTAERCLSLLRPLSK